MKLAVDYPIKYSDVDIGDITFCLAPFFKPGVGGGEIYQRNMFDLQKNGRQIMLDNGAWEFGESMDSQEYLDIIDILEPTWAVIPDAMRDPKKTISLARDFIPDLINLDNRPKLMFAPQGSTTEELIDCYNAVMDDYSKAVDIVCIPKNVGFWKNRVEVADILWHEANKKFKKVHFLGFVNMKEFNTFKTTPWKLVSMDTKYPVKITYAKEFKDQLAYYYTNDILDLQALNYMVKGFKLAVDGKIKFK